MPVHAVTDEPAFTHAAIADSALESITRRVLGEDFQLEAIRSDRFPCRWGSIGTAGLWRVDVGCRASVRSPRPTSSNSCATRGSGQCCTPSLSRCGMSFWPSSPGGWSTNA